MINKGARHHAHAQDLPSGGNGLPGMKEWAPSVGGTLAAGPRLGGGFGVEAQLPLTDPRGGCSTVIGVLLVDDQALVRWDLEALLDDEGDIAVLGGGGDGAEALRLAGTCPRTWFSWTPPHARD